MPILYQVRLSCGHSFVEHRPESMRKPVDGELRSCGAPEHYTGANDYAATYEEVPPFRPCADCLTPIMCEEGDEDRCP